MNASANGQQANATAELLELPLPGDRLAEVNVCGGILFATDRLDAAGLFETHFVDEGCRIVFEEIRAMRREGIPVDTEHLVARLKIADVYETIGGGQFVGELLENAKAAPSLFPLYADRLKDIERRRRTYFAALGVVKGVHSRQPTPELVQDAFDQFDVLANEEGDEDQPYEVLTMAQLAEPEAEPEWAVRETVILGQAGVIGAPAKTMKTSVATDLAVSAATATKFLGVYDVPRPMRVLFLSAESGREQSRICFTSVAESRGYNLGAVENLFWHHEVPFFGLQSDIRRLKKTLRIHRPELLILDPAYRVLPGDRAENMFIMGQLLGELDDVCRFDGVTPIVCHHTKKKPGAEFTPTTLEDLSWAGFSQFFRQWILLSRRKAYQAASGIHELRFDVGGSARHSWSAAITIDEGPFRDPRWYVTYQGIVESNETDKAAAEHRRQEAQASKVDRDKAAILAVVAKLPDQMGTKTEIKERTARNSLAFNLAFATLLNDGHLMALEVTKGNNRKYQAYTIGKSDD